jgi:hypothetical protein
MAEIGQPRGEKILDAQPIDFVLQRSKTRKENAFKSNVYLGNPKTK